MWRIASAADSYRPDSEDRLFVHRWPDGGALLAVADGIGGRSGGRQAAEAVITAVENMTGTRLPAERLGARYFTKRPSEWLRELDRQMTETVGMGETTAVVALLTERVFGGTNGLECGCIGAAVGDSVAWHISDAALEPLTRGSERKPWVGSGTARAVGFSEIRPSFGWVLLATDGLVKYTRAAHVCDVVRTVPFDEIPRRLIDLARLPNGLLQDDVAVIVARWEPDDGNGKEEE